MSRVIQIPRTGEIQAIRATLAEWFGRDAGVAVEPVIGRDRGRDRGGDQDGYPLEPEELACTASMVGSRRAEFAAGRYCARQALRQLAANEMVATVPITIGERGAPNWPAGYAGSITHAEGIAAAVVAHQDRYAGIGVDLVDRNLAIQSLAGGGDLIYSPKEALRARAAAIEEQSIPALLFSAKESVIKAVAPRMDRYLDFREIQIEVARDAFVARVSGMQTPIAGKWLARGRWILTTATVDRS